jgi:Sulfatase
MLPSRNRNAKFLVVAMTVMCLYVGRNLHGSIDMRRVESSSSSLDMNEMGFEPPVRLRVADNNPEGKPPQRHLDTIPSLTTLNTQQVNVSMGLQDFESHKPLRTHTTKDIRTTSVKEEEKQVSEEEASTTTSATKSHVATEAMGGPPLNILVLYPDDWRHNTIGKESSIVKTPFLDSLADQGIRFRQNAVTTSVCWVSRATLFTGQWASKHESHKTQCPHFAAGYRWRESSWPGILQKHGYFTGHVVGVLLASDLVHFVFLLIVLCLIVLCCVVSYTNL